MILEEETFYVFGYYPSKRKYKSEKPILAACDRCGTVRETTKNAYRALCTSCAHKGKTPWNLGIKATEERKANISAALEGNTYALGSKRTDEQKANLSKNHADFKGEKHPRWQGGLKQKCARNAAKRRGLGHTPLMPVKEGEVGHHVTNDFILGIPAEVHKKFAGGGRKKHRTKVLQWLKANDKKKYKMVLCVLAKEPFQKSSNSTQKK
jgi:nitroreductase